MKKYMFFLIAFLILPLKTRATDISANCAILMDMDSNRIMYSKNIHEVRSVASISKIMTAVIVLENIDVNKKITIGTEIEKAHGSGIYIKQGEILTIKDLLYGLLLRSGNDAALALAYHTTKDVNKFVELMNKKAEELNMKDSKFNNPSGLDDDTSGNYSSCYDMAIFMSYASKNKLFKEIEKTKIYKLKTNKNVYSWTNKNKLLKTYKYTTGGKTGYTKIAKRTLVTTSLKDNLNLVVVTLNDGNDWDDHKKLFNYGYDNYKNYEILKKGNIEVYEDDYYEGYDFYVKNNYYYPLNELEKDNILLQIKLEKSRTLKDNEKIGIANIYLGDKLIHEENIYLQKTIKRQSTFSKIRKWFNNLW